jgi:hypothetical protein
MGLCSFGLVAGVIQRYTHRYKALQVFGICVKIIGYGLLVDKNGVHDVGRLVMSQLLTVSPLAIPATLRPLSRVLTVREVVNACVPSI